MFRLTFNVRRLLVPSLLGVAFLVQTAARGQDFSLDGEGSGRQWAILIGVENYRLAPPLAYTINDVDQLAATLRERGGVAATNIVKFVDNAPSEQRQPSLNSLMQELPKWFQKPGAKDRLLVYFSGHGFRSSEGKLYLAPLDCDPKKPEATGLSVAWLREQIAGCRAGLKLLVLDSCHAGNEKGEEDATLKSIVSKDLGEPFRDLDGVITLASSTGDEKSQIWAEKRQSLFTYWLNQGLKGHADGDGDGSVDVDELNKYLFENVTQTASSRFHRPQTPVRIIRSGSGVPVVLQLAPMQLKHLVSDMADQVIWNMESRGLKKVGVLQFTTDTKFGEALGGEFGSLGRWCTAELEHRLLKAGSFEVVDSQELITTLKQQAFTVDQIGSREALAKLAASMGGLPAIVTGTLRHRQNRMITLQSKLKQLDTNALAAAAGGTALLNEHEWAMLGYSVAVKPEDRPLPFPGQKTQDQLIKNLDQKAKGAHPLADPRFPYKVSIWVGGKERKGVLRGNDYIVPLSNGEIYSIRITLASGDPVYMRLLVDGLNTLPQKLETKGLDTMETAPIVKLDMARGWALDPKQAGTRLFEVAGFVTATGAEGALRRFKVVDDNMSLAVHKNFTENVGLITAAFYTANTVRSGTNVEDQETKVRLVERVDVTAGDLLSVVNIRYVSPEQMGK